MSEKRFRNSLEKGFFANKLLERIPETDYIKTWTQLVMQEKKDELLLRREGTYVVFRLKDEWFALSTALFNEVSEIKKIHKIPHKSSRLLLGAVNMRGRLRPVFNLHATLEVGDFREAETGGFSTQRLISIQKEGEDWIFPVDEISKIVASLPGTLENVPVTVSKSLANYLKGVMIVDNHRVGLLEEELLFNDLKRSLS